MTFYENILNETSSFELPNQGSQYLAKKAKILGLKKEHLITKTYEVDVNKLSLELENINTHIQILKIDTEGHEYDVLLGLFNTQQKFNIQIIQLEQHEGDMYENKNEIINQLLSKNSYFLTAKIKHGIGNYYELIYEKK